MLDRAISTFMQKSSDLTENVGTTERVASVVAGSALIGMGIRTRSAGGVVAALTGGALLFRGATGHCPIFAAIGLSTAEEPSPNTSVAYGRGVQIEEEVTIARPREEIYRFWRNLENLPRVMSHLRSVTVDAGNRSHWVARGPADSSVEWDAEVINEVENELIGWRSLEGSAIDNAGSVHFEDAGQGRTRVRVILRYDPPGGRAGAAVARMLGEDPAMQIREDLQRLEGVLDRA